MARLGLLRGAAKKMKEASRSDRHDGARSCQSDEQRRKADARNRRRTRTAAQNHSHRYGRVLRFRRTAGQSRTAGHAHRRWRSPPLAYAPAHRPAATPTPPPAVGQRCQRLVPPLICDCQKAGGALSLPGKNPQKKLTRREPFASLPRPTRVTKFCTNPVATSPHPPKVVIAKPRFNSRRFLLR